MNDMIEYTVQRRYGKNEAPIYAIMRRGKRGGIKFITAYRDKGVADHLCALLNMRRSEEV